MKKNILAIGVQSIVLDPASKVPVRKCERCLFVPVSARVVVFAGKNILVWPKRFEHLVYFIDIFLNPFLL